MFSAYLHYKSTQREYHEVLGIGDHLTFISHAGLHGEALLPTTVSVIPCVRHDCRRCLTGVGGFTFRWYSIQWHDEYLQMRSSGSWLPGELESDGNPSQGES